MLIPKPNFEQLTTKDRYYVLHSYRQIQSRLQQHKPVEQLIEKYHGSLQRSAALIEERQNNLPKPKKNNDLPITGRWDEIAETIVNNPVSIICGHTGSGKTTQIPQICLDIGLGARGKIAHTQPRRIAARTVAARIAEELDTTLGKEIGYKVRFDGKYSKETTVLLQTDGMLLAEIQQDKFLNNYEVIIIDEAHERSLNIDFLLGYLHDLLPKRPDLKMIITSATIDPVRFAKHFSHRGKPAPIIMVEGKTFPIKSIYRPLDDDAKAVNASDSNDVIAGICRAVKELDDIHYGDTLVFLPTERDIRETQEALEKLNLGHTQILSLFARQTAAVQNAIFHPKNNRRIILSTNVAETSVTVPRILNVIDSGFARISRYSHKSKIQQLPIEPISRASADQRQGRCGRIAEGVCIRLYSEIDYLSRPEFTDPEIKRTSLASVILQMLAIGLGDIDKFPFVETPEHKMIADGYKLLFELQAVNEKQQVTQLGRQMASLPIDPRFAAVLLYAKKYAMLKRLLPIVCALVVGDIKERPFGKEQAADTAHRLFAHKQSDFLFYCNVFETVYPLFTKSKNQARQWAKKHYISVMRLRDWLFLLEQLAEQLDYQMTSPENNHKSKPTLGDGHFKMQCPNDKDKYENEYQGIHEALLVGFLDHVGSFQVDENDYIGARNKRFHIFPGSFLCKKRYNHVFCAEIVESSRVFARQVAKIDLAWLAPLSMHLTKTIESEPMWSKKKGNVMVKQTLLLYGLPIVVGKLVPYARSHPEGAYDIFVRQGLVENAINTSVPEIAKNRRIFERLLKLEEKSRSRNILIDENTFAEYYLNVIPNTVYSVFTLQEWYAQCDSAIKKQLQFREADFLLDEDHGVDSSEYPNFIDMYDQRLSLSYEFNPASKRDGITVSIPLASLNTFTSKDFDYLVPAMLKDKITALMKSLPKRYRRQFIPAEPYVTRILNHVQGDFNGTEKPLIDLMIELLEKQTNIQLTADLFDIEKLDKHFLMNIAVMHKRGEVLAEGRDLQALQADFHDVASADFNRSTRHVFAEFFRDDFPKDIAETYQIKDKKLTAYPALIQAQSEKNAVHNSVGGKASLFKIELFDSREKAQVAHTQGVVAFVKQGLNKEVNYIKKQVLNNPQIALAYRALAIANDRKNLLDDIVDAVLLQSYLRDLPRNESAYQGVITAAKKTLVAESQQLAQNILNILVLHRDARAQLKPTWRYFDDIDKQLSRMVYAGFISATPVGRLADIERYLKGVGVRLKKAQLDPQKEAKWHSQMAPFLQKLDEMLGKNKRLDKTQPVAILDYAYLLEEYRLSIYAQGQVKVLGKVSEKRLEKLLIPN